jgi:hypothetical protein
LVLTFPALGGSGLKPTTTKSGEGTTQTGKHHSRKVEEDNLRAQHRLIPTNLSMEPFRKLRNQFWKTALKMSSAYTFAVVVVCRTNAITYNGSRVVEAWEAAFANSSSVV